MSEQRMNSRGSQPLQSKDFEILPAGLGNVLTKDRYLAISNAVVKNRLAHAISLRKLTSDEEHRKEYKEEIRSLLMMDTYQTGGITSLSEETKSHIIDLLFAKLILSEGGNGTTPDGYSFHIFSVFGLEAQPQILQSYYQELEKNQYANGVSFLDKPTGKNLNDEQVSILLATTVLTAKDTRKRGGENTSKFTYYNIIEKETSAQKSLQLNAEGIKYYKESLQYAVDFFSRVMLVDELDGDLSLKEFLKTVPQEIEKITTQNDIVSLYKNTDSGRNISSLLGIARAARHIHTHIASVEYPLKDNGIGKQIIAKLEQKESEKSQSGGENRQSHYFSLKNYVGYIVETACAEGGLFASMKMKKNRKDFVPTLENFTITDEGVAFSREVEIDGEKVVVAGRTKGLRSIMTKMLSTPDYNHVEAFRDMFAMRVSTPAQGNPLSEDEVVLIDQVIGDDTTSTPEQYQEDYRQIKSFFGTVLGPRIHELDNKERVGRISIKGPRNFRLLKKLFPWLSSTQETIGDDEKNRLCQWMGVDTLDDKVLNTLKKKRPKTPELAARSSPGYHDIKMIINIAPPGYLPVWDEVQANMEQFSATGPELHEFLDQEKVYEWIVRLFSQQGLLTQEIIDTIVMLGVTKLEEKWKKEFDKQKRNMSIRGVSMHDYLENKFYSVFQAFYPNIDAKVRNDQSDITQRKVLQQIQSIDQYKSMIAEFFYNKHAPGLVGTKKDGKIFYEAFSVAKKMTEFIKTITSM